MRDQSDLGVLLRIVGALDALVELMSGAPTPMGDEGAALLRRSRQLGYLACEALDTNRAELLKSLLGEEFFGGRGHLESFGARASLGILTGYLRGCISEFELEQQCRANALAYADAKVRQEREVTFEGSG